MYCKIALLLLITCPTGASYSQNTHIGLTGGAAIATMKAHMDGRSDVSDAKTGFTAGVFLQTAVSRNVVFMPAVNFVQKGYKDPDLEAGETDQTTLNYLELPLNLVYATNGFFIGAGPALSVGLSGTNKYSSFNGDIETGKVSFGSGDGEVKQLEFSGNLLAGYQFSNGFMISANYNMGFSNLINNSPGFEGSLKNRYWGFKIGYVIWKK